MFATLVLLPAMATSRLGRFFGADAEPAAKEPATQTADVEARAAEPGARPSRADLAAATGPAPHRVRTSITADDRHEVGDGPHSSLHEKLQRLRRPAGDSPTS
jgi:hypothetical protein